MSDNINDKAKMLIKEVNKDFENEYKPRLEALEKAMSTGKPTSELEATIAKMDSNFNALQAELDAVNTQMKSASFSHGSDKADTLEKNYSEVFAKSARGLDLSATDREVVASYTKAMSSAGGTGTNGGLTVPKGMADKIAAQIEAKVPFLRLADLRNTSFGKTQFLIQSGVSGAEQSTETTASANTSTPSIIEVVVDAVAFSAEPHVTRDLLNDSAVDIEAYLINDIANAIADKYGEYIVTKLLGAGASAQTNVYNIIELNGATPLVTTPAGTFSLDDLYDVKYDVNPRYSGAKSWVMGQQAMKAMRKFKDNSGQYLWQPSHQVGQPALFDGEAVEFSPYFPALTAAANLDVLVYGDFKAGLGLVKHVGADFLVRDEITNKKYVKFYNEQRWGAEVTDGRALRILRTAAAKA